MFLESHGKLRLSRNFLVPNTRVKKTNLEKNLKPCDLWFILFQWFFVSLKKRIRVQGAEGTYNKDT